MITLADFLTVFVRTRPYKFEQLNALFRLAWSTGDVKDGNSVRNSENPHSIATQQGSTPIIRKTLDDNEPC